jgi:hypothetical protein
VGRCWIVQNHAIYIQNYIVSFAYKQWKVILANLKGKKRVIGNLVLGLLIDGRKAEQTSIV